MLDAEQIAASVSPRDCLDAARIAFETLRRSSVTQPERMLLDGAADGLLGVMPIHVRDSHCSGFGVKSVAVDFSSKADSHSGVVVLHNYPRAGETCILDAGIITDLRTAAASAFVTSKVTRKTINRLCILGTGKQALTHARMMCEVRPIDQVKVWGRNIEHCEAVVAAISSMLPSCEVQKCERIQDAVSDVDVICTVTASRVPFLARHHLSQNRRVHINSIGASTRMFQELHSDIFDNSLYCVDSIEAIQNNCRATQEAIDLELLPQEGFACEVGSDDFYSRDCQSSNISIFRSVGLAIQDYVLSTRIAQQEFS